MMLNRLILFLSSGSASFFTLPLRKGISQRLTERVLKSALPIRWVEAAPRYEDFLVFSLTWLRLGR